MAELEFEPDITKKLTYREVSKALLKLQITLTETLRQRDELVKGLRKYGEHSGLCYKNLSTGDCNCGLEQLIASVEGSG